jgi:1-deoxy-D-xylulose-5-phosphate reductoisomerase
VRPAEQIKEFAPSLVSIQDGGQVEALKELIKGAARQPEIVVGDAGMVEVASHPDAQSVVTGIVGCAGLAPTCAAITQGKDICLANKETLIAGDLNSPIRMGSSLVASPWGRTSA